MINLKIHKRKIRYKDRKKLQQKMDFNKLLKIDDKEQAYK